MSSQDRGVIHSIEPGNSEKNSHNDGLYSSLIHHLDVAYHSEGGQPTLSQKDAAMMIRMGVEDFVRERTRSVPELPWLEERLNPPRLDIPPSLEMSLPPEYEEVRAIWEKKAEVAYVPYAPPIEYLNNPPKNLFQPKTELDRHVLFILQGHGLDTLHELAASEGEYRAALHRIGGWEQIVNIHATWAKDGARDGVDMLRSLDHEEAVAKMFRTGDIIPNRDRALDTSHPIVFPLHYELAHSTRTQNLELELLLQDIKNKIDNRSREITDYDERSTNLLLGFRNIIDGCRWHLEHKSTDDTAIREMLNTTLEDAYLGFNTVLQTCNTPGDDYVRFHAHHDISTLIAGLKIDNPDGEGREGDRPLPYGTADYLDAFMAVGQYADVAVNTASLLRNRQQIQWTAHDGVRPIFGDLRTSYDTMRQQLTTLCVMYLRMPEWQKETYSDLIMKKFGNLETKVEKNMRSHVQAKDIYAESPLYVPSRLLPQLLNPASYMWTLNTPKGVYKTHALSGVFFWTHYYNRPRYQRYDGRIQVKVTENSAGDSTQANRFVGLGSSDAYVDKLGFIHPGNESHPLIPKSMLRDIDYISIEPSEAIAQEPEKTWIEQLNELPSVLVESRLGTQGAEIVEGLLEKNPETGSVVAVSHFASAIERLLGRKPNEEQTDFISLLEELSMLNEAQINIDTLGPEDVPQILEKMRTGEAKQGDIDRGSLLIMMMATTGSIPRELLVELILKNYKSLESALTLELATTLEHLDNRRLSVVFHLKEKSHPILDSRKLMREYLDSKANEVKYDPQADPKFQEMATTVITKVTKILHNNKTYDATMKSPLIAVLAAKEKGQLSARCEVDGQSLLALLKFISPELATYCAQTYGPEELLSLQEWYTHIEKSRDSGGSSHAFTQTNFRDLRGSTRIVVADANSGSTFAIEADKILDRPSKNAIMKYGEASHTFSPHIYAGERESLGMCVKGGSYVMASLAGDVGELEYALLANPDDPELHRHILLDENNDLETRANSLDFVLTVQPRWLTMTPEYDYQRASTAESLRAVVQLGRETGRWGGALFAANILKRAGYFSPEINVEGESLCDLLSTELATLSDNQREIILTTNKEFLVSDDVSAINTARQIYLAKIDAKHSEEEVRKETMMEVKRGHEIAEEKLRRAVSVLYAEENRAKQIKEDESPSFGSTVTEEFTTQMRERSSQIIKDTVEKTPSSKNLLDAAVFERTTTDTQDMALTKYLSDENGERVDGATSQKRMLALQQVITQVSLELTMKKTNKLNSSRPNRDNTQIVLATIEEEVVELALELHKGLEKTADRLNISLPRYSPISLVLDQSNEMLALAGD